MRNILTGGAEGGIRHPRLIEVKGNKRKAQKFASTLDDNTVLLGLSILAILSGAL
jgi:hypothetical protein